MHCPFLKEAHVEFCRASAYKKMIVRLPEHSETKRCTTPEYINCPSAKDMLEVQEPTAQCPFLHESLVQYCTAAAVTKYIPYSESLLSQCGTDSHKYCELYQGLAQPSQYSISDALISYDSTESDNTSIRIPETLWFTPNHMWLDIGDDGILHIGIDEFFTKVIGTIDGITFVTTKGFNRPTVVVSVNGVDLQFVFPIPVNITKANTYLRTNPEKIFSDPYTLGWLFEATESRTTEQPPIQTGMVKGEEATKWINKELSRMTSFAHMIASRPDNSGAVLMADGGKFQASLARHLNREALLKLYNEFFSPYAAWNAAL